MKKKTAGLLCLAAGLLVGAAVAAPMAANLAKPSQGQIQAASSYDIAIEEISGITVTAPSKAEAGSVVDVTVQATSNDIAHIDGLNVDDLKASQIGDGQYRFVMPAHAVTLHVSYERVANPNTHAIGRTVGFGLNLVDLPDAAEEGESVTFAITFDARAGYTFNGFLDIYTLDADKEKKASLDYSQVGSFYTFEMPAEEVFVEVGTEKRTFSITKSAENAPSDDILRAFGEISVIEANDEGGESVNPIIRSGVGAIDGRAEFGSKIRVALQDIQSAYVKGLYIVETGESIMLEDGAGYVEFILPGCNVTLQVLFETRYYDLRVIDSDHVTLEIYHQVKDEEGNVSYVLDENETPKAQYEEVIYVKAVSRDPNFGAQKVLWTATGFTGDYVELNLNRDGYYTFTSYDEFEEQLISVLEAEAIDVNSMLTIHLDDNAHLLASALVQDGADLVAIDDNHKAFPSNKLFIDVQSSDAGFGVKSIAVEYMVKVDGGDSQAATGEVLKDVDGMHYIVLPENIESISITITEQPYFDSYGFTGRYVGKYLSGYSEYSGSRDAFTEITPWGTALITNYNAMGISSVTPAAEGATYGTFNYRTSNKNIPYSGGHYHAPDNQDNFTTSTEYIASYSSKFVVYTDSGHVAGDGVTSPINANETNTIVIGVKQNSVDMPIINIEALHDGTGDMWWLVTAQDGDELSAMAINKTKGELYNNEQISVTFDSGDSISESDVHYFVKNGNENMLEVLKVNGQTSVLDGLQGTYALENDATLVLDGTGKVIYGDVEASYTKNPDGTISFMTTIQTDGNVTKTEYVATLNKEAMTASIDSTSRVYEAADPAISYGTYPFAYDANEKTYTSGNAGISSSSSYMFIDCDKAGIVSFDYVTEGEGAYDFAIIKHNNVEIFSSKGASTQSNLTSGHIEIEVEAGDKITIQFTKDSSSDVGTDNIVISNLLYYVEPDNGAGA